MHCQKLNTYMETGRVVFLPFSAISPNPNQPRTLFPEGALEELLEQLRKLAAMFDASYEEQGAYPAWEYKKDSELRDTMVKVYTEMYGKAPEVLAIHAGLECGLLGEKIPGLDCVSVGPQMHDIHTSRERLEIASTRRTWNFLLEVLKAL